MGQAMGGEAGEALRIYVGSHYVRQAAGQDGGRLRVLCERAPHPRDHACGTAGAGPKDACGSKTRRRLSCALPHAPPPHPRRRPSPAAKNIGDLRTDTAPRPPYGDAESLGCVWSGGETGRRSPVAHDPAEVQTSRRRGPRSRRTRRGRGRRQGSPGHPERACISSRHQRAESRASESPVESLVPGDGNLSEPVRRVIRSSPFPAPAVGGLDGDTSLAVE